MIFQYYLGFQTDVKKNEQVQIRVDGHKYKGYMMYALYHDNPEYVNKTIKDFKNANSPNPFIAWTSSEEDTIYAEVFIENIGNVQAAIVRLNESALVNFKFTVLSSDPLSKFHFSDE